MKKDKEQKRTDSFLQFLIKGVPEIEPPEGFAFKASRFVPSEQIDFSMVLQSMAQKLVPVFMSLAVLATVITYLMTANGSSVDFDAELFFQTPENEEITIEYVLDSIGPLVPRGGK